MGLFTKKQEVVIEDYVTKEAEGAEVWLVTWKARTGEYSSSYRLAAKAFVREEDANQFAESLKEAKALLQYTENIDIKVEKQV